MGLSQVYVQGEVTEALRGRAGRGAPEVGEPRRMTLRKALDHAGPRLVLVGPAGSGKSTLLKQLVLDLLKERKRLPLLFHVQHAVEHRRWEDAFVHVYGEDALPLAVARVAGGQAVLLLDGLDEASVPARGAGGSVEAVERWARGAGQSPLLVASREEGFSLPHGFARLGVLPMEDAKDQRKLLTRLGVDGGAADAAIQSLSQDEARQALLQNPMMLTLVGLVLLRDGRLPERRAELYERAVSCLIERKTAGRDTRPEAAIHEPGLVREALEHVCGALHGSPRDPWPVADICRALRQDRDLAAGLSLSFRGPESWLQEQARKVGLLLPVSAESGAGYGVPHRTLREYLAACGLVRAVEAAGWPETPPDALAAVLEAAKQNPGAWAELLALAVARAGALHPERVDRLLGWIVALGDLDLAWRAFDETPRLLEPTALALWRLGRGTRAWQERWEDRSRLLQRLPELLGDVAAAVPLTFALARESTHGADLFWARQVLGSFCTDARLPAPLRTEAGVLAARVFREHRREARAEVLAEIEERGWWKVIPAGRFRMGSTKKTDPDRWDGEGPQHTVEMARSFQLLAVPVTNRLYERFDPGHAPERDDFKEYGEGLALDAQDEVPVYNVSWYEAVAFALWLGCRLPTESEWEYACRAGSETRFWSGGKDEDLFAVGWVSKNSKGHPHPVAQPPKQRGHEHPWGLYDLHGNVWEWGLDPWEDDYDRRKGGVTHDPNIVSLSGDPAAPRVIRGGSWGSDARDARSAFRDSWDPWVRFDFQGFRLVRLFPD